MLKRPLMYELSSLPKPFTVRGRPHSRCSQSAAWDLLGVIIRKWGRRGRLPPPFDVQLRGKDGKRKKNGSPENDGSNPFCSNE